MEGGSGARKAMKESGLYYVFRNTTLPTPVAGTSGSNRGGAAGRTRPIRHSMATMIRNGGMLPTPMATDGMPEGRGGGAGSTYPFRMMLATPRKTDADRGGRGDVLSQLQGHQSRHAGMLGTPTANPAPRGTVLRRMNDRMTSDQDGFDRAPNPGEMVHFFGQMPTPVKPNGGRTLSREAIETGKRSNGAKAQIDTPNLLRHALETLPTPTKRDSRMDAWSPAYDRRKSPSMDAVMDGAMLSLTPTATGNLTAPAMQKWTGAKALAALLRSHGLTGTAALPITYGWMMGFPPGWLTRALRSAVRAERLRPVSSSRRSGTRSSRRSRKP